jgi:hypothetical protein
MPYPETLDTFHDPAPTESQAGKHAACHVACNSALRAMQTKVGVDNSNVPTTIDYRMRALETAVANLGGQTPGGGPAFPVGSIFSAVVDTDPATLLGYGTWERFGQGRVLVGQAVGDPDFGTGGVTGGSKQVTPAGTLAAAPSHTHTYSQIPNHTHPVTIADPGHVHAQGLRNSGTAGTLGIQGASTANNATIAAGVPSATTGITAAAGNPAGGVAQATTDAGGGHTHAFTGTAATVLPPFVVVYLWRRVS